MSELMEQVLCLKKVGRRKDSVKALAETIILQSIEDLWCEGKKGELLRFFNGEGFSICAGLAGIGYADRIRLLALVREAASGIHERRKKPVGAASGYDYRNNWEGYRL